MNRSTTHDPESNKMLELAYSKNLNVVARIGNPYYVREHSDEGSNYTSYKELAKAYASLVNSLPLPISNNNKLYIQVGNEFNACNEWKCKGDNINNPSSMSTMDMAKEVGGFYRDVLESLIPLRDKSNGNLLLGHGAIASWTTSPCQCGTGRALGKGQLGLNFLKMMLRFYPNLYINVDFLSSHSYPFSQQPYGTKKAMHGLVYYRNESVTIGRSTIPVHVTETGWRRNNVTFIEQAKWMVSAFKNVWLPDSQILSICPFLLAGKFWDYSSSSSSNNDNVQAPPSSSPPPPFPHSNHGGWTWINSSTLQVFPVFESVKKLRKETTTVKTTKFLDFGSDFIFGQVMDAYQFEGALKSDGRGPASLDVWCDWYINLPEENKTLSTPWKICGDVGAGFYKHFQDDVKLMKSLGQKHLHFQIAWTRIFSNGDTSNINMRGIAFYDKLIDTLLDAGITPYISIEVFDFPQAYVKDFGGWISEKMIEKYRKFARVLFEYFGDRVKSFFSFHEPDTLCGSYGSSQGRFVGPRPSANDSTVLDMGRDQYKCIHNMLLGHAAAYEELIALKKENDITLSLIVGSNYYYANDTTRKEDLDAAERALIWGIAAWFDPLFFGDYPHEMRERVGERLPTFTKEQSEALVRSNPAFLGVNHYTSSIVAAAGDGNCLQYRNSSKSYVWKQNAHYLDQCLYEFKDTARTGYLPNPYLKWLSYFPRGMRDVLNWMGNRYKGAHLLVTESGVGLDGGSNGNATSSGQIDVDINDQTKIDFLRAYWSEAYKAKVEDGVNLRGIFHWSFLDNLEWGSGYSAHFGMVHVNHSDPTLKRTPKKSALWYKDVIEQHGFESV